MRFKFFYVLILLIIVILVGVYVFETVKIDALSINKDINEEKVEGRSYIKLKYLGKSKYDKKNNVYIEDYNLEKNSEFTWYAKCYGENVLENLDKGYGTNFVNTIEDEIDTSKQDVFISFGRKLNKLYFDDFKVHGEYYLALPVFDKEYYGDEIFLYVAEEKYNLIDNEYWTNELYDFNVNGNIRYKEENMPYE